LIWDALYCEIQKENNLSTSFTLRPPYLRGNSPLPIGLQSLAEERHNLPIFFPVVHTDHSIPACEYVS